MSEDTDDREFKSTLPGPLGWIDTIIAHVEAWILAGGVILMAALTCTNVIGRFVFGQSIFFTEEVNRILIVLITFAGISYAARQGRHIRMSAIYDALPFLGRKILMIIICIVTAVTMFGLFYFSLIYINSVYESGRILPATQIGVFWAYVWVPVGLFFTGIQYALTAFKNIFTKDIYISTTTLDGYEETDIEV